MAIDPAFLVGLPTRVTRHAFTRRDTILYALGVGAGQEEGELDLVYENILRALPTYPVVLAYPGFWQKEPRYGIDWPRLLHAEQSVTLHGPVPVEGEVRGEMRIEKIIDKGEGRGALLYSRRDVFNEADAALIATVRQVSFLRGDGGCGSVGEPDPPPHRVPERSPDGQIQLQTRPEQALIYRLSGNLNPLHLDPKVARQAGLAQPILHGLCTYGFCGRALMKLLCDGQPGRIRRMDCRFTAPVTPGQTLRVSAWIEGPGRGSFMAEIGGGGPVVLNNGYLEFTEA